MFARVGVPRKALETRTPRNHPSVDATGADHRRPRQSLFVSLSVDGLHTIWRVIVPSEETRIARTGKRTVVLSAFSFFRKRTRFGRNRVRSKRVKRTRFSTKFVIKFVINVAVISVIVFSQTNVVCSFLYVKFSNTQRSYNRFQIVERILFRLQNEKPISRV